MEVVLPIQDGEGPHVLVDPEPQKSMTDMFLLVIIPTRVMVPTTSVCLKIHNTSAQQTYLLLHGSMEQSTRHPTGYLVTPHTTSMLHVPSVILLDQLR